MSLLGPSQWRNWAVFFSDSAICWWNREVNMYLDIPCCIFSFLESTLLKFTAWFGCVCDCFLNTENSKIQIQNMI